MTGHDRAAALERTLVALADPTRRAIVRRLADGAARVTDVAAPFPMSLAAVSKHIRVLESAGIVRRAVRGREHLLQLDPASLTPASDWIADVRQFWGRRLDDLEHVLIARAKPRGVRVAAARRRGRSR